MAEGLGQTSSIQTHVAPQAKSAFNKVIKFTSTRITRDNNPPQDEGTSSPPHDPYTNPPTPAYKPAPAPPSHPSAEHPRGSRSRDLPSTDPVPVAPHLPPSAGQRPPPSRCPPPGPCPGSGRGGRGAMMAAAAVEAAAERQLELLRDEREAELAESR